ncbi:DUF5791 family protein [Natrialbaceae archaeon A-arb3/5]
MFYDQRMTAPPSPDELRAEYEADLAAVVDRHGVETVVTETDSDLDRETIEAVAAGESVDLTLEEAAQVQALDEDAPDPETIVTMACEHLLLGMSTAVLDVDALAGELGIDLDAKEIQQKIERRAPMTFREFVHVQYTIASNTP